jgi:hypothetical protein
MILHNVKPVMFRVAAGRLPDDSVARGRCWHAPGITAYLKNSGKLEVVQHFANHDSPRTTKLYDRRRQDETSLDEVERALI